MTRIEVALGQRNNNKSCLDMAWSVQWQCPIGGSSLPVAVMASGPILAWWRPIWCGYGNPFSLWGLPLGCGIGLDKSFVN
jgi:hypothetical protein